MTYLINHIFATVQGEGALNGTPAVFVRLHGCGVGCPWCDTKETWEPTPAFHVAGLDKLAGRGPFWCEATGPEIADHARAIGRGANLAVITGGEPAEQNLVDLVCQLHRVGFRTALETSGTANGHVGAGIGWVCLSPKLGMPGGKPILSEAIASAHEIKGVIGKRSDLDRLDAWLELMQASLRPGIVHSLQPISQNRKATDLCVQTCIDRGWRLSIQTHKYIEIE